MEHIKYFAIKMSKSNITQKTLNKWNKKDFLFEDLSPRDIKVLSYASHSGVVMNALCMNSVQKWLPQLYGSHHKER